MQSLQANPREVSYASGRTFIPISLHSHSQVSLIPVPTRFPWDFRSYSHRVPSLSLSLVFSFSPVLRQCHQIQKYFDNHPSERYVSYCGIAQRCTNQPNASLQRYRNSWEFLHGLRVVPIPVYVYSHPSLSILIPELVSFPYPSNSRGIPVGFPFR